MYKLIFNVNHSDGAFALQQWNYLYLKYPADLAVLPGPKMYPREIWALWMDNAPDLSALVVAVHT